MLVARDLVKRYPGQEALRGISFDVEPGRIVGLLGPNGAGKTTLIRIATGYMPATSGNVFVDGFSVRDASLEVRRRLGYLPENAPLYPDLRVDDYLNMRARLKRIHWRERERAVRTVMEDCFIRDVARRRIGALSKGYRQRVGLADALLGEPKLIILDEPTAGLDPNQVQAVRERIRDLGGRQTVLLSTHLLGEVEATCDDIILLHEGRVVADGSLDSLETELADRVRVRLEMQFDDEQDFSEEAYRAISGVTECEVVRREEGGRVRLRLAGTDCREAAFRVAVDQGATVRELRLESQSLEGFFARLTAYAGEPGEED